MARAKEWLSYEFDPQMRESVQWLIDNDPKGLNDAFGDVLKFGTGGLRALMGVGTNRLNIYTVRQATQGLANYLLTVYPDLPEIRIAIAYDCRNNSLQFAEAAADTLAANKIRVYLYDSLRPTPQLSFTVRAMRCHAGIVITASHNPKEYNGYKVYWCDGAQVVPPHDTRIIEEVAKITSFELVKRGGDKGLIVHLAKQTDEAYLNTLLSSLLNPNVIRANADLKIVFTPIHGSGTALVPQVLKRAGFTSVQVVAKQREPDGNFPTVSSPNPEDPKAMEMALELAQETVAELVLGTDPDADRMGAYVRNANGELVRLDGNQIAVLLAYYLLHTLKERGKMPKQGYIVRSIVTSPLLDFIANSFSAKSYSVLTGFKYIAELIEQLSGKETFLMGAEESHGYLMGDSVRDKDAVQACLLFSELTAWCKSQGMTPYELLERIYKQYGLFSESQRSITLSGQEGKAEIEERIGKLRANPPKSIAGEPIVTLVDYQKSTKKVLASGEETPIEYPKENVLQLITQQGSIITVRPSGTEPKIKYYCSVQRPYSEQPTAMRDVREQIELIINEIAN